MSDHVCTVEEAATLDFKPWKRQAADDAIVPSAEEWRALRLAAANAVAIVDLTASTREYFDLNDGTEVRLEDRPCPAPPWRERLRGLDAAA